MSIRSKPEKMEIYRVPPGIPAGYPAEKLLPPDRKLHEKHVPRSHETVEVGLIVHSCHGLEGNTCHNSPIWKLFTRDVDERHVSNTSTEEGETTTADLHRTCTVGSMQKPMIWGYPFVIVMVSPGQKVPRPEALSPVLVPNSYIGCRCHVPGRVSFQPSFSGTLGPELVAVQPIGTHGDSQLKRVSMQQRGRLRFFFFFFNKGKTWSDRTTHEILEQLGGPAFGAEHPRSASYASFSRK